MPLRVDITAEPGLHDMLAGEQPVSQDQLLDAIDDFVATPGVAGTPIEDEIRMELRQRAQDPAEAIGAWDALKRFFRREEDVVVETVQQDVELAAYWLTLPDLDGARAIVTSSTSHENETSASVKIAGVGGGPTLTISVEESVKFDVRQPERAVLTCRAPSTRSRSVAKGWSSAHISGSPPWTSTTSDGGETGRSLRIPRNGASRRTACPSNWPRPAVSRPVWSR
jgi:hypothetical protein